MWYKTDLMEQILTSKSAKQMIDYVSPVYGKSRIGLWLFQVIGLELDDVKTICEDIIDQIFVNRATWGLGKRIWNNTTSGSDDRAEESTDFANEGKKAFKPYKV